MSPDLETAKNIATIAAPLTSAIVETWLKPRLAQLFQHLKTDKALSEHSLFSSFDEYLLRTYQKNSYFTVLVFQNQQKKLEDLYIPLSVVSTKDQTSLRVDDYTDSFIPAYEKVLIVDTAGMGKSTIMKFLYLKCVERNAGIPILVELRKLVGSTSVLDVIHNELNAIDDAFDKDFILKLIAQGGFVFFLDGYDEIPFSDRGKVTFDLHDFIGKASNNLFVITSRPELSLSSFPQFQQFKIKPLTTDDAFSLLRKYDSSGELSAEIISKLEDSTFQNVKEFMSNPLLVSLLYKSYEYKPTIPFKKHIFYRQVYDSLFESHDLTKGGAFLREKHSGLDIEDFHRILRALGFITVKLGQVEFDKDSLIGLIRDAKMRCPGISPKEADLLKDLLTTVPLFNRDGEYYRWAHKSIQEYFAAQFICVDSKGKQNAILRRMWRSKSNNRYFNVLDLAYDMDYKTFRRTIIYDFISEFLDFYSSSYVGIDREIIDERAIHFRKLLAFYSLLILLPSDWQQRTGPDTDPWDAVEEILEANEISTEGYAIYTIGGDPPTAYFSKHENAIVELLGDKHEQVFTYRKIIPKRSVINRFKQTWKSDLPIVVNDDPHSVINQSAFFTVANDLLADQVFPERLNLSYKKCIAMKRIIEQEIEEEKSDSFFVDEL